MFSKDEVDSWNEIFPDSKIDAANLNQPNESFLAHTLAAYLRVLGYQVPDYNIKMEDHSVEKRQFLIQLAVHIDYILKITNAAYSFTYYDLIRATTKKTKHMFRILLNYLYYYDMYKKTIFKGATDRIQELEAIQRSISETKVENEKCLEKIEEFKTQKDILAESLPTSESKMESLISKRIKQKEDIERLEKTTAELLDQCNELTSEKNALKKQSVSDDEARILKTQYSKLQSEIDQMQQKEQLTQNGLQESINSTDNLDRLCQAIEQAKEIVPIQLLEAKNLIDKQLKALNDQSNELDNKRQQYISEIAMKEQELKVEQNKFEQQKTELEQQKVKKTNILAAKEREIKANAIKLDRLKEQEQGISEKILEQHNIQDFLCEALTEVLNNKS